MDWLHAPSAFLGPRHVRVTYDDRRGSPRAELLRTQSLNAAPPPTIGVAPFDVGLTLPATTPADWYFIAALGDEDTDGVPCVVLATSFSNDLIISGEGN